MPTIAERLRPDMFVVGSDYTLIGRIKLIEESELLLDRRPLRRDVWVPMHAVDKMIADWVVLAMPADQVDPMEPFLRPRIGDRAANSRRSEEESFASTWCTKSHGRAAVGDVRLIPFAAVREELGA